jgi:hypothetical protein
MKQLYKYPAYAVTCVLSVMLMLGLGLFCFCLGVWHKLKGIK